jgi:hypothetical protein
LGTNWEPNGNDHGRPPQGMGCGLRACAGALLPLTPPVTPPRGRCRRQRCRQEAPGSGRVDGRRRRRYCVAESACMRESRAAPLRGAAGAPATGLCVGDARPARARRRRQLAQINHAHPACLTGAARSRLPHRTIVPLAGTAYRPPDGRRFAMASPA